MSTYLQNKQLFTCLAPHLDNSTLWIIANIDGGIFLSAIRRVYEPKIAYCRKLINGNVRCLVQAVRRHGIIAADRHRALKNDVLHYSTNLADFGLENVLPPGIIYMSRKDPIFRNWLLAKDIVGDFSAELNLPQNYSDEVGKILIAANEPFIIGSKIDVNIAKYAIYFAADKFIESFRLGSLEGFMYESRANITFDDEDLVNMLGRLDGDVKFILALHDERFLADPAIDYHPDTDKICGIIDSGKFHYFKLMQEIYQYQYQAVFYCFMSSTDPRDLEKISAAFLYLIGNLSHVEVKNIKRVFIIQALLHCRDNKMHIFAIKHCHIKSIIRLPNFAINMSDEYKIIAILLQNGANPRKLRRKFRPQNPAANEILQQYIRREKFPLRSPRHK